MTFTDAVRRGLSSGLRFSGRASRSEFWWFALFEVLAITAASILDIPLHRPVFEIGVGVVLLLPSLSVSVRRLHDTGRSGWWVLVEALVPLLGLIWLLILCAGSSEAGPNQYGPPGRQTMDRQPAA